MISHTSILVVAGCLLIAVDASLWPSLFDFKNAIFHRKKSSLSKALHTTLHGTYSNLSTFSDDSFTTNNPHHSTFSQSTKTNNDTTNNPQFHKSAQNQSTELSSEESSYRSNQLVIYSEIGKNEQITWQNFIHLNDLFKALKPIMTQ